MIQCVLWAVKHELFTIYDLGLDVLYVILEVKQIPNKSLFYIRMLIKK